MAKYRKKPVVVEAVQWDGTNEDEINKFVGLCIGAKIYWSHNLYGPNEYEKGLKLNIQTLEGVMRAKRGDYIIKGVNGEIYPCKPDVFEKTYEKVGEE